MANDKELTPAIMHECFIMLILLPFYEEDLLSSPILVVGTEKSDLLVPNVNYRGF
jgi:hypothetical protein